MLPIPKSWAKTRILYLEESWSLHHNYPVMKWAARDNRLRQRVAFSLGRYVLDVFEEMLSTPHHEFDSTTHCCHGQVLGGTSSQEWILKFASLQQELWRSQKAGLMLPSVQTHSITNTFIYALILSLHIIWMNNDSVYPTHIGNIMDRGWADKNPASMLRSNLSIRKTKASSGSLTTSMLAWKIVHITGNNDGKWWGSHHPPHVRQELQQDW